MALFFSEMNEDTSLLYQLGLGVGAILVDRPLEQIVLLVVHTKQSGANFIMNQTLYISIACGRVILWESVLHHSRFL